MTCTNSQQTGKTREVDLGTPNGAARTAVVKEARNKYTVGQRTSPDKSTTQWHFSAMGVKLERRWAHGRPKGDKQLTRSSTNGTTKRTPQRDNNRGDPRYAIRPDSKESSIRKIRARNPQQELKQCRERGGNSPSQSQTYRPSNSGNTDQQECNTHTRQMLHRNRMTPSEPMERRGRPRT